MTKIRYSVVKFTTEKPQRSDVVPNKWLKYEEEQLYCYYPKNASGARLETLKAEPTEPDMAHLNRYWKKKVFMRYYNGKRQACETKLGQYIDTGEATGLDTDHGPDLDSPTSIPDRIKVSLTSSKLPIRSSFSSDSDSDGGESKSESPLNSGGEEHGPPPPPLEDIQWSSHGHSSSSGTKKRKLDNDVGQHSPASGGHSDDDLLHIETVQTPKRRKVPDILKKIMTKLYLLDGKVDEMQKMLSSFHKVQDPSKVIPEVELPAVDPNILAKVELALKDSGCKALLTSYLTTRGVSASKTYEACDSVFGSLLTNHCGHFINLHGNRAKDGGISESGRIGMAKIFPRLFSVITEVFKNIAANEKNKLDFKSLMKHSVTWLSKRTEKLQVKPKPVLPWIFSDEISKALEINQ